MNGNICCQLLISVIFMYYCVHIRDNAMYNKGKGSTVPSDAQAREK